MDKKRRLLEAWKAIAEELQESHGYTLDSLVAELHTNGDAIPLTAFGHGMTPLEAAARYLKHSGKNTTDIARSIGRTRSAVERMLAHSHVTTKTIAYTASDKLIPASVFTGTLPASQALCMHLRERYGMTNKQIADALGIDQRTVWTVLHRAERGGRT